MDEIFIRESSPKGDQSNDIPSDKGAESNTKPSDGGADSNDEPLPKWTEKQFKNREYQINILPHAQQEAGSVRAMSEAQLEHERDAEAQKEEHALPTAPV